MEGLGQGDKDVKICGPIVGIFEGWIEERNTFFPRVFPLSDYIGPPRLGS